MLMFRLMCDLIQHNYALYGLTFSSNVAFTHRLLPARETPTLTFRLQDSPPPLNDPAQRLYPAPSRHDPARSGLGRTQLYARPVLPSLSALPILPAHPAGHHLHFNDIAAFDIEPGHITGYSLNPKHQHLIEIYFLGLVMSFYLEQMGIPALHASAAVVEERTVVFLSTKSGGKSSLAAGLMQQGSPLLTDDILAVELRDETFWGRPGYPQMRFWPEQADYFLGYSDGLEIVHANYKKYRVPVGGDGFGAFSNLSHPLACIYLPERRDPAQFGSAIEIVAVSQAQAVMELVRHSFVAHLVQAAGWQPQRLTLFAQLVRQIPMRRLIYPAGVDYLPRVCDAILEDLAAV